MSRRGDEVGRLIGAMGLPVVVTMSMVRAWERDRGAVFAGAVVIVLQMTLVALQACWTFWPARFPTLRALEHTPRALRMPGARRMTRELDALGFVVVGPKNERSLFFDFPSLELWHPEHRTFASLSAVFGVFVRVAFITASREGKLLYTSSGGVPPRRDFDLVVRASGQGLSTAARFEEHVAALQTENLVGGGHELEREDETSKKQLVLHRLAITRRWYVARFGTDAEWSAYDRAQTSFVRAS